MYDHIVVGAGHNGLIAGCTLAEAGRRVLVVERLPVIGGLAASHAYVPEAPDHVLSLGAMDNVFMASTSLERDLRLHRYGYRATRVDHPYGWLGRDGESLLLFHDVEQTLHEIRHYSPPDARAYAELLPALNWMLDTQAVITDRHPAELPKRELAKRLLRLAPSRSIRRTIGRMVSSNYVEMIAETFASDQLRALCLYWGSMIGPIDQDGVGYLCLGLGTIHRQPGVMRPTGGMGGLMHALANHFADHGGELRTGTGVERIFVDGGRAAGVRLENGEEHRAAQSVLHAGAPQHLSVLLEDGVLDAATQATLATLPASANNAATLKVDMAVGGPLSYPKVRRADGVDVRTTALMTGTFADQIAQQQAIRDGRILDEPPVYMAVLSAQDPTIAPDGQDVFYLAANTPVLHAQGWDAPGGQATVEAVVAAARRHVDGLDAEIGRVVTTPQDLRTRFGTPHAAYFHVDMTPLRLATRRPAKGLGGYTTPVAGLYLAGAGSHPGGGVNGWPGRLAAQTALSAV